MPEDKKTFSFSDWSTPQPPAELTIEIGGENEENEMQGPTPRSQEIDAQVDKFQQDNLSVVSATMLQTGSRFNDGSAFVAQESKQSYVHMSELLRTQNANNLEKDGLAASGQQYRYERGLKMQNEL